MDSSTRKRHSFVSLMKQTEVTVCIRNGKLIHLHKAVAVGTEIIVYLFARGVAEVLIKRYSGI
jgi:hypothetical protein